MAPRESAVASLRAHPPAPVSEKRREKAGRMRPQRSDGGLSWGHGGQAFPDDFAGIRIEDVRINTVCHDGYGNSVCLDQAGSRNRRFMTRYQGPRPVDDNRIGGALEPDNKINTGMAGFAVNGDGQHDTAGNFIFLVAFFFHNIADDLLSCLFIVGQGDGFTGQKIGGFAEYDVSFSHMPPLTDVGDAYGAGSRLIR